MKTKNLLATLALLAVVLMSSCQENSDSPINPSDMENTSAVYQPPRPIAGVNLGMAGYFVILSKTGVTNVYKSTIRVTLVQAR